MSELKGYNDDDAQLAQMGHKAELKRQFSLLYVLLGLAPSLIDDADMPRSMLGLAFAILNVCVLDPSLIGMTESVIVVSDNA